MFTGLIEHCGRVRGLRVDGGMVRLEVETPYGVGAAVEKGESVAVNGVCLTVVDSEVSGVLGFDVLEETLRCTALGSLGAGAVVNLERAMSGHARFGGHIVQGHVDGKGSIAVDGISLTVASEGEGWLEVCIIPHTRSVTNLAGCQAGALVNLEFEVIAKYIDRMLEKRFRQG